MSSAIFGQGFHADAFRWWTGTQHCSSFDKIWLVCSPLEHQSVRCFINDAMGELCMASIAVPSVSIAFHSGFLKMIPLISYTNKSLRQRPILTDWQTKAYHRSALWAPMEPLLWMIRTMAGSWLPDAVFRRMRSCIQKEVPIQGQLIQRSKGSKDVSDLVTCTHVMHGSWIHQTVSIVWGIPFLELSWEKHYRCFGRFDGKESIIIFLLGICRMPLSSWKSPQVFMRFTLNSPSAMKV